MIAASDIVEPAFRLALRPPRRAVSSFEALVAFTLLTSVLGMSVPLVVRHGRLLTSARQYRLARHHTGVPGCSPLRIRGRLGDLKNQRPGTLPHPFVDHHFRRRLRAFHP
jgi:hypothetical protein